MSNAPAANHEPVTYTPDDRMADSTLTTVRVFAKNLWIYRELLWQLFKRDFLGSYRKSFLGYLWLLIAPLANVFAWLVMQYAGILHPGNTGAPYPIYLLLGTSLFSYWTGVYQAAAGTLTSGAGILTQVKYPHEILLAKQLAQHFANFILTFGFVLAMLFIFGLEFHISLFLLPIALIPATFVAIAFGLVASMISIVASDVTSAVNIALGLLVYLSPIVYSSEAQSSHLLGLINKWNPLTHLICSPRDLILYGHLYDNQGFIIVTVMSVPMLAIAWRLFYVGEQRLIEKIL